MPRRLEPTPPPRGQQGAKQLWRRASTRQLGVQSLGGFRAHATIGSRQRKKDAQEFLGIDPGSKGGAAKGGKGLTWISAAGAGVDFFIDDHMVDSIVSGIGKPAGRRTPSESDNIVKLLASVPLFKRLTAPRLRELSAELTVSRFEENDIVIYENDPGESFYVILSGSFKIITGGRYADPDLRADGAGYGRFGSPRTSARSPRGFKDLLRATLDLAGSAWSQQQSQSQDEAAEPAKSRVARSRSEDGGTAGPAQPAAVAPAAGTSVLKLQSAAARLRGAALRAAPAAGQSAPPSGGGGRGRLSFGQAALSVKLAELGRATSDATVTVRPPYDYACLPPKCS